MPIVDPWEYDKPKSQKEINDLAALASVLISDSCRDDVSDASSLGIFRGSAIPTTSITEYIFRFVQWTHLNESELIGSLIILDRYLSRAKQSLNSYNVHRLVGISLIIAQKNFSDRTFKMGFYARIYGVLVAELLKIEETFLVSIDFDLFTTAAHFLYYKSKLFTLARELEMRRFPGMIEQFAIALNSKEQQALCTSLLTMNEDKTYSKELNEVILLVSWIISEKVRAIPHQVCANSIGFYCASMPPLSIRNYIINLVKVAEVDENELIGMLILLDRYLYLPNKHLNYLNVHFLIASALIIAQKSFSDMYYSMDYYSNVIGIPFKKLLGLESRFVSDIDFNVFVSREHFLAYKYTLVVRAKELEVMGHDAFQINMATEEETLFCSRHASALSDELENSVANVNQGLISLSIFNARRPEPARVALEREDSEPHPALFSN